MNDLNLHISRLLLEHNCVIVPDLGGFVTQYCPAHFDEVAGVFVAPSCQVGFNPLLQADDGLLAQSFMMANQTSYDEAMHDIRLCVHQLRETMRTRKEATLMAVGTFRLSPSGAYDFTPIQRGLVTPDLFGLAELPMPKVKQSEASQTVAAQLRPAKDSYTFQISKSALHYVAAAAVAVVFYFIWAAPLNRTANNQTAEALMFEQVANFLSNVTASPEQKADYQAQIRPYHAETKSISADELMRGGARERQMTEDRKAAETNLEEQPLERKPQYALVVASQVPLSGAKALVNRLHEEGLTEARIVQHHKMVRVVVGNYAQYEEARQALKEYRKHSAYFVDSWVLKEEAASETKSAAHP